MTVGVRTEQNQGLKEVVRLSLTPAENQPHEALYTDRHTEQGLSLLHRVSADVQKFSTELIQGGLGGAALLVFTKYLSGKDLHGSPSKTQTRQFVKQNPHFF